VDKILVDEVPQPLRMQGQYFDEEAGLCYNRHRYFDPQICSFISQDPIGLLGGDNVYAYAPNVWAWVDPLGLKCETGIVENDPDALYRTISPRDPHYKQFKKIGDVGYIKPRGGHNDLDLHVQHDNTKSIFTSWSKDQKTNWEQWAEDGYIQLRVDTKTLDNHAIDVSKWSYFPEEKEVSVIGKVKNVVRVK
jgi:RHS repeat-associated protein